MKLALISSALVLSSLSLGLLAGCTADASADDPSSDQDAVVDGSENDLTSTSNFGFFVVTHAGAAGSFFVKRVNQDTTKCANGTLAADCEVSAITMTGIGLSDRETADVMASLTGQKALVKAAIYKKTVGGKVVATLKASQAWVGATGSAASGSFYRVADNGIRCITAPCPSTTAYQLNGHDDHNVISANLKYTATPPSDDMLDVASRAMSTKEGVLLAGGVAIPKCVAGSTTCGPTVIAQEFYVRVTATEGKSCGGRGGASCNAGQFCHWTDANICGAFDAAGACDYKPDFCPALFQQVCGCDGATYGNYCYAQRAGTSVSSTGPCAK